MFNLRCTAKLLGKLKCEAGAEAAATTRLGDWYGNLFRVGRQEYAIFTSERSLLTVILPPGEIAMLPQRLSDAVRRLLTDLQVAPALIDAEIEQMQGFAVTKTANRSVLGSVNDLAFHAKFDLGELGLSLAETHERLAKMPLKAIGYRYPIDAALELLPGQAAERR